MLREARREQLYKQRMTTKKHNFCSSLYLQETNRGSKITQKGYFNNETTETAIKYFPPGLLQTRAYVSGKKVEGACEEEYDEGG